MGNHHHCPALLPVEPGYYLEYFHLMADVERTCDRIIVLQSGQVVQSGEVGHFTKETETVFIEVDSNREGLIAALEQRGVVVAVDGSGLSVQGRPGPQAPRLPR